MICTICNKDLPESAFQTYYHSTQQVYRTRKQCTSCFNKKKNEAKKLKKRTECLTCGEFKLRNEFPNYKALTTNDRRKRICKKCTARESYLKRKDRIQNNFEEKVYSTPNRYSSDFQKEAVFDILKAINWQFNEETGTWFKPGLKDENKNWNGIITERDRRLQKSKQLMEFEEKRKKELDNKIIEYFNKGTSIYLIEKFTGKSSTYIVKRINEDQETRN